MQAETSKGLLKSKLLYTFFIVLVYLVGKGVPLYRIDYSAYTQNTVDAEALLVQTISGDINQCSLFALGVSPYMISSILVQVLSAFKNSESQKRTSPTHRNKLIMKLTLLITMIMAVVQVQKLQFTLTGDLLFFAKAVAALEMVAGAFLILHLVSRIKKYGVGGQTILIFMNILDGIIVTLRGQDIRLLAVPLLTSVIMLFIMIFMENTEMRIPVQRISIHNIYADKNYLAIKLNPIGVMPVMFATAFFILVQMLISLLGMLIPGKEDVLWLQDNITLSRPLGIAVYILLLFLLTVGFSRVMINPKEISEQFLKSGDSLTDIHAGRDTKRYLSRVITGLSLCSAMVMSICVSVPMILQWKGEMVGSLTTLPSSIMMLTGIWCNLYREVASVRDLEAYKPFI